MTSSISLAEYKSKYESTRKKPIKRKKSGVGVTKRSEGEQTLSLQLKALKIAFQEEYQFHPTRKWRSDFYITDTKLLIEVEGGIWTNGRHTRGSGYLGDMEKYNEASKMGFTVLRFSTQQVKSGFAIKEIQQFLGD